MADSSIVDHLNSLGKASDLTSRAALATSYGYVKDPSEYIAAAAKGTNADINTKLLADLTAGKVPTPAPAPTTPTPTVRRYTGIDPIENPGVSLDTVGTYVNSSGTKANGSPSQLAAIYGGSPTDWRVQAPDEATIRAEAMDAVRGQLDSTNNVYADLASNREKVNTDNLGRTRAVAARSGTLDSDFGATELAKTKDVNAQADKAIQDERQLKLDTILGQVNEDVQKRVTDENTLATKNNEDRTAYLKDLGDRATAQIQALAQSGASVESLTDDEYNHLLSASGYTPDELKASFVLNKPKDTILHSEVVGSNYIQVSQDPITKKTKTDVIPLGVDIPQGYKVEKLDNGQLVFYPDKFDPTKSTASQIITYGAGTGVDGAIKFSFTSTQKSKLLGLGFDPSSIGSLETYLKSKSVDDALGAMSAGGKPLSDEQKNQLKNILSGATDSGA